MFASEPDAEFADEAGLTPEQTTKHPVRADAEAAARLFG